MRTSLTGPAQTTLSQPRDAAARENSDFVRRLLTEKQPEFARALASAERALELECQVRRRPPEQRACRLCGRVISRSGDPPQ